MPQAVYDNFLGGLSPASDNRGGEGSYAESRDIDPHRDIGYLMPGWVESNKTSTAGGVLAGLITDAVVNKNSTDVYAAGGDKVYEMSAGTSFTDDADWPHAFTGASHVVNYPIGTTDYIFAMGDSDIMRLDPTGPTFIDDYLTNGSYLNSSFNSSTGIDHFVVEWESYLWIADGRYLGKLDGSSSPGTYTNQDLDLGEGWKITALFPTRNYLGICAHQNMSAGSAYRTGARVFFYDGTSSDYSYSIPIEDNEITAALNDGGKVYLVTRGRGFGSTLRRMTTTGDRPLRQFKTFVAGSKEYFYTQYPNSIDVFQNRVIVGATSYTSGHTGRTTVFTYGHSGEGLPDALAMPYSTSDDGSASAQVGFVGQLIRGSIFVSLGDGTNQYWMRFSGNYSTRALWRGLYTEPNQKVRLNYVKFYFKDIDTQDQDNNYGDITPTLEVDDGTSVTLKDEQGNTNISYTTDSTMTTKRFNLRKECHRFRPVLDWTSGAVAFYKIVIDYDNVNDL